MTVSTRMQVQSQNIDAKTHSCSLPGTEAVFRSALNISPVPFLITDPNQADNPVVYANQAFLDMTGYSAEEIIGRNCRFLQGPETDPAAIAGLRHAMNRRCDICMELINYRKDGTPFWNEVNISPVFNDAHELTHFFALQKDITQRRAWEDSLAQAHKIEALGDLTGGIAHDFNNLLQVMSGYLDLIERSASHSPDASGKIARSVSGARDAAERATMLTRQLLAFSRKQRLDTRSLNLNEVIQALYHDPRSTADGMQLETRLEPDLWHCNIDPANAETALTNILDNAREALEERSDPQIRVETTNVVVQGPPGVPAWAGLLPGNYVSVAISDNGIGMDEAVRPRAMDPFFSTKGEGRGSGLGLSTVQGFVLQSGGNVRIQSVRDVGTTVRLYFPAVRADQNAPATAMPSHRPGETALCGTESILIVEDRAEIARLACDVLASQGYRTTLAFSGDEAWARIEAGEHYQLLFSDVLMPGTLNGVELARRIERQQPDISILLTSGFTDNAIESTDALGSRYALLSKPYRADQLLLQIRTLLDHKRSGRTDNQETRSAPSTKD